MATGYDLIIKSDADILTDLSTLCLNVEGFSWVSGDSRIIFTNSPSLKDKSTIERYFSDGAYKKWIIV